MTAAYFLFRHFGASQGRWLVPDPAGMAAVDLTNPKTWNRYAYVGGNPLNAVDPVGLSGTPTPTQFGCGQDPACRKAFGDSVMQAHQGGVNQGPAADWGPLDSLSFTHVNTVTVTNSSDLLSSTVTPMHWVPPDESTGTIGHYGTDPSGGQNQFAFTIQIGFSYNFHFWGAGTGTGFAGVAVDSHGNVGTYHGGGAGLSAGTGASAGFQLGLSNGNSICALGGPFGNFSGTFGVEGVGGTADYFTGQGDASGGVVHGGGVTFGLAGGASASSIRSKALSSDTPPVAVREHR